MRPVIQVAETELEAAQTAVKRTQADLDLAYVRSPIAGQVIETVRTKISILVIEKENLDKALKGSFSYKFQQTYMTAIISEHIQIMPGVCGGKPRIAGHRIRVQDIVIWYEHLNMSPDEIVYHYPSITLADVHAALAYSVSWLN